MRFIDSSYEIIEQPPGLIGVYKQIERAARTAYKSEDRITEDSAKRMVDMLCKQNHGAALEHGTIYLKKLYADYEAMDHGCSKYIRNPYSKVIKKEDKECCNAYITTNARVIFENGWENDLQYICEPTEYHKKRITVKFVCSIGICREILRHRRFKY
jgi:thymidylate synthase (FAD)